MADERCADCGCPPELHRKSTGFCVTCGRDYCQAYVPREERCCPGEPCNGDPNGMHTFDCPVYLANVEAWEKSRAPLTRPMPGLGPPQSALPPAVADLVEVVVPLRGIPQKALKDGLAKVLADADVLELFEAWRCDRCGSRSWKRERCNVLPKCGGWMEPVTVEIRRRS